MLSDWVSRMKVDITRVPLSTIFCPPILILGSSWQRQKRKNGPDRDGRRIRHLSRRRVRQNKRGVRPEAAFPESENQFAGAAQRLFQKPTPDRPCERHRAARQAHKQ